MQLQENLEQTYFAFSGQQLLASGPLTDIVLSLKNELNQTDIANTLFFEGSSGMQLDIDPQRSTSELEQLYGKLSDEDRDAASTIDPKAKKPRGRPKLGVVGREVTLLPRHWLWLDKQRGGASAALRRLVDAERKAGVEEEQIRHAQDSANRFMNAMGGNLPGFEEAMRALYARDKSRFEQETQGWPADIRDCARLFAEAALI